MIVKEYKNGAIIYLENQIELFNSNAIVDDYIKKYNFNESEIFNFPNERLVITPEDETYIADAMARKLANEKTYIELVESKFDISDPFCFENKKIGDRIENGYMKLINILLFLRKDCKSKELITINLCDTRFHMVLAIELIRSITKMSNKAVLSIVNKFVFDAVCKKIDSGVI